MRWGSHHDRALMTRIRKHGDGEAFRLLFDKYKQPAWYYVCGKVPADIAEDVFQNTGLKFYTFLTRQAAENPAAILMTIARDAVAEHYRTVVGKLELQQSLEVLLDQGMEFSDSRDQTGQPPLGALWRLMRKQGLSHEQREIFVLHYYVGYTVPEIADLLGLSENTIKGRLRLAKAKLGDPKELQS